MSLSGYAAAVLLAFSLMALLVAVAFWFVFEVLL